MFQALLILPSVQDKLDWPPAPDIKSTIDYVA
jgi:hypothetical protein